jgi:hypothetical protein
VLSAPHRLIHLGTIASVDPNELEASFAESWGWVERFYREELLPLPSWQWLGGIVPLIGELKARGYDRSLRAGQSLYVLILSRSREHGLRDEQSNVAIEPRSDGSMRLTSTLAGVSRRVIHPRIELCLELERMLETLRNEPVT